MFMQNGAVGCFFERFIQGARWWIKVLALTWKAG
jgi:hypothetical protein